MKKKTLTVSKSPMKVLAFGLSVALLGTSISGVSSALAGNSTAQSDGSNSTKNLGKVINPDTNEEMFVVKSTFYDYYSDSQVSKAKGSNPGAIDDGVYGTSNRATDNSFVNFNNMLYKTCDYGDTSINRYPMYCGLFFGDQNSDVNGGFYYKNDNGSNIAKNFWLGANSSQKGGGSLGLHAEVNAATQGLVDSKLAADGNVTQAGGTQVLPYFNAKYLTSTTFDNTKLPLGKVMENVSFPFRTVEKNGVKTYEFDSKYDTVHVDENGSLSYLGYNKSYNNKVQVLDQKRDDGDGVKPGFFPYNTASDSDSTRLNYGFGLKLEIPFNMTSDGKINGQDIVFNFSGDDDVWVFIDDELVLDIGGAHGEVSGSINFSEQYATVSGVKDNAAAFESRNYWYVTDENIKTNVKSSFSSALVKSLKNTTASHKLTMFYMERGKIESNMKVNFNLPQPNSLTLTNTVKTDKVNDAFKEAAQEQANKDIFSYDVNDSAEKKSDTPLLKNGESTVYTDQFTTGDALDIKETEVTNDGRDLEYLYETSWDLNDQFEQISNSENRDEYVTTDDRAKEEGKFLFENISDAATTNLIVNYYNEINAGDLVIGKSVTDDAAYKDEKFTFDVAFSNVFGGSSSKEAYAGEYYITYEDGTVDTKTTKNGEIVLKAHEYATIVGVPVETKYQVTENNPEKVGYELTGVTKYEADYSGTEVSGTIKEGQTENYYTFVNTKIIEATPEPVSEPAITAEPTVAPTEEPTAIPTIEPTVAPTVEPTVEPTAEPTATPYVAPPLVLGNEEETPEPTIEPTEEPEEIVEDEEVPNEDVEETEAPEVEEVEPSIPSSSPKTGDNTNIIFWILSVIISAGAVVYTGKDLFMRKKER